MINKHYNFEISMGATISDSVVKEMVTSIVEKQVGKKVKSIDILYDQSRFTGYSVTFDSDSVVHKSFKPTTGFIAQNWDEN